MNENWMQIFHLTGAKIDLLNQTSLPNQSQVSSYGKNVDKTARMLVIMAFKGRFLAPMSIKDSKTLLLDMYNVH